MKLITKNSVYEVTAKENGFDLTKIQAQNPNSTYNSLGETRHADCLTLRIGEMVNCGLWHTSPLVRVEL